jgi:putative endonuclease
MNRNCYTYLYRPVTLVYYTQFTDFRLAIKWEKRIKSWSKKKKEALIQENWNELQNFSKCQNESIAIPKATHSSRLRSN